MSGYTITNCPNIAQSRQRMRGLAKGEHGVIGCRLRGRGVPAGADWRDYQWQTPLKVAPRFTAYYGHAPYRRFEFIKPLPHGRVHLRRLADD